MKLECFHFPDPPFFHWARGSAEHLLEGLEPLQRSGLVLRHLRGSKMTTLGELFDEFAAALQFPPYFGENWDALDECLNDLEWLPAEAYILVILDADQLLIHERDEEFRILVETLQGAAEQLAEPLSVQGMPHRAGLPFHMIFQTNEPPAKTRLHSIFASMKQYVGKLSLSE